MDKNQSIVVGNQEIMQQPPALVATPVAPSTNPPIQENPPISYADFNKNFTSMSDDDFVSNLASITAQAKANGASDSQLKEANDNFIKARSAAQNPSNGAGQDILRGIASPFTSTGTTIGTAAAEGIGTVAKGVGSVETNFGSFISKWFPSFGAREIQKGAATQETGNELQEGARENMVSGVPLGVLGNVIPAGGEQNTMAQTGAMTKGQAMSAAALESTADGLELLTSFSTPELPILATAGAFGLGEGAKAYAEGEPGTTAIKKGAETAAITAATAGAFHVAFGGMGNILNKMIKNSLVKSVMDNLGGMIQEGAKADIENPEIKSNVFEEATNRYNIGKASVVQSALDSVPQQAKDMTWQMKGALSSGIGERYGATSDAFDPIFNRKLSLNSENASGFISDAQDALKQLGATEKTDLTQTPDFGKNTDSAIKDNLDKKLQEGLDPEMKQSIQVNKDVTPELQGSRSALIDRIQKLIGMIKRPGGITTEALQSYISELGFGENSVSGKYSAMAKELGDSLRGDFENYIEQRGLTDQYHTAVEMSLQNRQDLNTAFKGGVFDSPNQSDIVDKLIDGDLSANDKKVAGTFDTIKNKAIVKNFQQALFEGIVSRAKNMYADLLFDGNYTGAFTTSSEFLDRMVSKFDETRTLLTPNQKLELQAISQAMKSDFQKGVESFAANSAEKTPEMRKTAAGIAASNNPALSTTKEAAQFNASTEDIRNAIQLGKKPEEIASLFDAKSQSDKEVILKNIPETEKSSLVSSIVQNKMQPVFNNIKSSFVDMDNISSKSSKDVKSETEEILGDMSKTYEEIKADKALWEHGLSDSQRDYLQSVLDAYKGLSSVDKTNYVRSSLRIASSPVVMAMGHPFMGMAAIMHGTQDLFENLVKNMEEMTPKQLDQYDAVMKDMGDDALQYQTFRLMKAIVKPTLIVVKSAKSAAAKVAGVIAGNEINKK